MNHEKQNSGCVSR